MDGVLVREDHAIPGAADVLATWEATGTPYLLLTNNSSLTPEQQSTRLGKLGFSIPKERIWTAAQATANFLAKQNFSNGVFVIGDVGLFEALRERNIPISDSRPDFVVIGDTRTYDYDQIALAARHISNGAGFIAASPDTSDPGPDGPMPATGALCALLSSVTRRQPYSVGKPNPVMMLAALEQLGSPPQRTGIIGDRLDTDITTGIEFGLHTVLVLTGTSSPDDVRAFPLSPTEVLSSLGDLLTT